MSFAASHHSHRRGGRRFAVIVSLALVAGVLPAAGNAAPVRGVSDTLVINEVDYDQPSTDAAEFVEIKNVSATSVALGSYSLELVNGTGGGASVYNTIALPDVSLPAGDYFVVCGDSANVANCDLDVTPDTNLIQNGAPDAVGLRMGTLLVDAVSYEGDSGAPYTEGSGSGVEDDSGTADMSISRCPDGADTDQNNVDFSLQPATPGTANSCPTTLPKLVINEFDYDQPGTDAAEFVELKNAGTIAIDLSAYTLELVNGASGGAAVYDTIALPTVSLAAGDYFVVCANAATVANCDLDDGPDTNFIQNGAPDAIGLRLSGSLVDAVSYEGDTVGYTEGSGAGLEDDPSITDYGLSRCPDGTDTDQNNVDFAFWPITPGATNICRNPGTLVINEIDYDQPGTDTAEFVEIKNVTDAPIDLDAYALKFINGSNDTVYNTIDLPAVSLAAGDYYVVCGDAAIVPNCDLDASPNTNFIQNGSPDAVALLLGGELIDTVSYEGNTTGYTEGSGSGLQDDDDFPLASIGRCPDGADTDQNNLDFSLHPSTPGEANACDSPASCGLPATPIHDIQGSGTATPLSGATVVIEGIVVGDYQQSGGYNGFFVQEQDAEADADPATSEGIFVFFPTAPAVAVGDAVTVCGTVTEFNDLTELSPVASATVESSNNPLPEAAAITLPVASISDLEAYEGMRVTFEQELTVTEVFTLARFGEVSLSASGRLDTPTNVVEPGDAANDLQDLNDRSRILLDDGDNTQNRDPVRYPQGGLSATNTLRVGDSLDGLTGVLDYRFGVYRVQPILSNLGDVDFEFDHTNPRPAAPASVGGNLKVASLNVLNYFNGDGLGGGFPTARGATNQFELTRQTDKLVSALLGMDADIIGLMELENDGGPNQALATLVSALNAASAPGTYAYVDTGIIGIDEIKVGLIYRPASVSPVGLHALLTSAVDARFDDTLNRPALAQSFELAAGGRLTVVVNHLKSKGSPCDAFGDPDVGDGQGNCNLTRTNAAAAMVDWIATDPTDSGDRDVLVIGDLNSYAKEDPIDVFVNAGFTDLHQAFEGSDAYTYVFQGQSGYLDHALASPTLAAQVTGMTTWHINPDEPIALDYNVEFKSSGQVSSFYDPGPYRSSDHDPVLVGIQLANRDAVGLLPPIGTATVKAGQTLPVQFSLGGFAGYEFLYETPQVYACADFPLGPSSDIQTAGRSMLSYDAEMDVYTIAWKTSKGWANQCRTVEVTFDDGSYLYADVEFVK